MKSYQTLLREYTELSHGTIESFNTIVQFFNSGMLGKQFDAHSFLSNQYTDLKSALGIKYSSKTMYRIFPQDGMKDKLPANKQSDYNSLPWSPGKIRTNYLKNELVGKTIPMQTGLGDIQNWTEDRNYPSKFHSSVPHNQASYFVIVEASFNGDDIVFGYNDFKTAEKYFDSIGQDTLSDIASKMYTKAVAEKEYIVRVHQPKPVKILEILTY